MSHDQTPNDNGFFIGIDFGTRYIGVACGQKLTRTATPLKTLIAKNGVPNWEELDKIIAEWRPVGLVVGLPLTVDGEELALAQVVRPFIESLHERYKLPVYEVGEQLTTKSAREMVFSAGGYKSLKNVDIDCIAAKLILEDWLGNND